MIDRVHPAAAATKLADLDPHVIEFLSDMRPEEVAALKSFARMSEDERVKMREAAIMWGNMKGASRILRYTFFGLAAVLFTITVGVKQIQEIIIWIKNW